MTIVFAILLIGILICLHELGHFVAAKLSGVQVNEFSIFMGPAIFKWQKGQTQYAIRCIPMGGYCAMEGEDGGCENPRAFTNAAWWKKLIILVAGSAVNFIAGVVLFFIVLFPAQQIAAPVLTQFTDCCVFNNGQSLQVGDEILQIDGEQVYINGDISMLLHLNPTGVHDVTVMRNGEILVFEDLTMVHTCTNEKGQEYLHYGIGFGEPVTLDFGGKLQHVWNVTRDNVRNVRLSLQMLLTGKAGLQDRTGSVGMVDIMSDAVAKSPTLVDALLDMLYFGGFLAVNLSIMNMLPIPALDGGRVVGVVLTAVVEKITRRKLDPKYEGYLHAAGMVLLLGLTILILFKDIFTIFKG